MPDPERIRVPTNGHHKPIAKEPEQTPTATADPVGPAGDPRIVITPGQLAAGFGILAGIVLLALGSRRRGKRR
jgi:hypothetical protein